MQVLFLSDGIAWHSDDRRNSVAAAVEVALQHQLQGVVLESGALRQQQGAAAAARRQGLQVIPVGHTILTKPFSSDFRISSWVSGVLRQQQGAAAVARRQGLPVVILGQHRSCSLLLSGK